MCYLGWAVRCWGKSQGAVVSGIPTFSWALWENTSPQDRPGLQRWFGHALSWRPPSMASEIELKLHLASPSPYLPLQTYCFPGPSAPSTAVLPTKPSPCPYMTAPWHHSIFLRTCFPSTGLPFPDFPHLVAHSSFKTPSRVSFFLETGGPLPPDHLISSNLWPLSWFSISRLPHRSSCPCIANH